MCRLLDLDGCAGGLMILLDLCGVVLADRLLDDGRCGLDRLLVFLAAKTGDGAVNLAALDLLLASGLEADRELGLLFNGSCRTRGRTSGHRDRGSSGNAKLLFQRLDQLHHLDEGLSGDRVDDLFIAKGRDLTPEYGY